MIHSIIYQLPNQSSMFNLQSSLNLQPSINESEMYLAASFSNTESLEDRLQHIVGRSRAGDLLESAARFGKIGQHELLRSVRGRSRRCALERGARAAHQIGVADFPSFWYITRRLTT